jgi:hypothetical protein
LQHNRGRSGHPVARPRLPILTLAV